MPERNQFIDGMRQASRRHPWPGIAARSVLDTLAAWLMRRDESRRQRRALARLDPWLLRDIGLSSDQISDEIKRLT